MDIPEFSVRNYSDFYKSVSLCLYNSATHRIQLSIGGKYCLTKSELSNKQQMLFCPLISTYMHTSNHDKQNSAFNL